MTLLNDLKSIFTRKRANNSASDQAVFIFIKLSDDDFGTKDELAVHHHLEDRLESIINNNKLGELDGDEFGGGYCQLFIYTPDADKLYDAIKSVLAEVNLPNGGYVIKRYGGIGSREIKTDITPNALM